MKDCIKEYLKPSLAWHLLPVHSIVKGKCSCGKIDCQSMGKHARIKSWQTTSSNNILDVAEWMGQWPDMNVGLLTGKPSRVIVIDIDEKDEYSGAESLAGLEAIYGRLPPTLSQTTGGHGKHYFFRYPIDIDGIKSSVGKLAKGIDVRADGAYVLLPPSNHKSGDKYQWNNWSTPMADLPDWLLEAIVKQSTGLSLNKIRKAATQISEGSRNDTLFSYAAGLRGKGLSKDEIFRLTMLKNLDCCVPPLDEEEVRASVEQTGKYKSNVEKSVGSLEEAVKEELNVYDHDYSERGNAFKYATAFHNDMRYCHTKKRWFIYDGTRWEEHHGGEPIVRMNRLIQAMKGECELFENEEAKKRYWRWIAKSSERRTMNNSIAVAQDDYRLKMGIDEMDMDPLDFNCLNGTLNLKSMELREHCPDDHITFLANVVYDPKKKCPLWLKHLDMVFDGDKQTIDSFQRTMGYTLTELNPEQVMFISWGNGKNGKSTTYNIIAKILGDYASTAQAESFMKMDAGTCRNDIARLNRKRMVITTEPPSGGKLNETLIKSATGTDKITARFLYQEFFDFVPAFKIFMATNHRPNITNSDEGIWRRLVMFPFDHVFSEDTRDMHIEEKLIDESSGILNWMVQGYLKYNDNEFGGLRRSKAMTMAVAEYRNVEDTLLSYVTERCNFESGVAVSKTELYSDFLEWCNTNGEESCSQKKFGMMVQGRYKSMVKEYRSPTKGRTWIGIELKNKELSMTDRIKRSVQEKI